MFSIAAFSRRGVELYEGFNMTAQAGLVFKSPTVIDDLPAFIGQIFGERVKEIARSDLNKFDTRNDGDILVERYSDTYFISNHDLAWGILENQDQDVASLYSALGSPSLFLVFCCYDSGGSYGYAFVEEGLRTRTRLQAGGNPAIVESGAPKEFEQRWLNAEYFYEDDECPGDDHEKVYFIGNRKKIVSEYGMTGHLLVEGLEQHFTVCPWVTREKPEYRYFKLVPKPSAAKQPSSGIWHGIKSLLKRA
jgi:hypothetical protein